jgi:predicted nucleotidyltransferase
MCKEAENYRYPVFDDILITCYRGGIAHNTYNPRATNTDDIDLFNLVLPNAEYYYGLRNFGDKKGSGTTVKKEGRLDILTYEWRKFLGLLYKGHPNTISLLWLEDKHYLYLSNAGRLVVSHRDAFTSKAVLTAFVGYITAELKKYEASHKHRYASHAIRLLNTCYEFMETKQLNVYRTEDRQLYIDIKNGEYKKEELDLLSIDLLKKCIAKIDDLTGWPDTANYDSINRMSLAVVREHATEANERITALYNSKMGELQ